MLLVPVEPKHRAQVPQHLGKPEPGPGPGGGAVLLAGAALWGRDVRGPGAAATELQYKDK